MLLINDALDTLTREGSLTESTLAWHLPERLRHRYTEATLRGLLVALVGVGGQLAETDSPSLRCLADELSLHVIIQHADSWLEARGEGHVDWSRYEDAVFEDMDFDLLYEPQWDGVEDPNSDVALEHGMVNLRVKDWFTPFRNTEPVHPYLADL